MKAKIILPITNKQDFWLQAKNGRIFHICEGTGDNLLAEDVQDGYVDYIYYEIYDDMQYVLEHDECDGGQVLLKQAYADMDIADIIQAVAEMEDVKFRLITKDIDTATNGKEVA